MSRYKAILENSDKLKQNLINATGAPSEELKVQISQTLGSLRQLEQMASDKVKEIDEQISKLGGTVD